MAKTTYSREELERQLSESRREFWAADATINNLELSLAEMAAQLANAENKCRELAAENTSLKQSEKEFNNFCREEFSEWEDDVTETPATDAFLAEVRAQGVDAAIEHLINKFQSTGHIGVPVMALEHFADQLRKGGNQ